MMANADAFSIWGDPPDGLSKDLTKRQIALLKRYIMEKAGKAYTMGFNNGVDHAFNLVSETVSDSYQRQRAKHRRS